MVEPDIIGDYVGILRDRLIYRIGYPKSTVDNICNHDELILTYFRVLRRFVSSIPRTIRKARDFVCPPEHLDALVQIENKIKIGNSINPYLSRKLIDLDYNDLLLNDWGIQHLHLGKTVYTKGNHKGFIEGTKELLYVYFDEECAYFIKILGHSDFTAQILLQTIHDNWPDVLASNHNPHVSGDNLRDIEIKELRRKHANYCLALRDGTSYLPIGGGMTGSGDNAYDVVRMHYLHDWAQRQTDHVLGSMPSVVERAKARGMQFSDPVVLRLKILDDDERCWVLDDDHYRFQFPLVGPWG